MSGMGHLKKVWSFLLAALLVVPVVSFRMYATETEGLCEHHTEHTVECGYQEGVSDCTYPCDVCAEGCIHVSYTEGKCDDCGLYQPCEGEGTETSPYLITNAGNLYWFAAVVNGGYGDTAQNVAAHAKLTADIVVNADLMDKIILAEDGTASLKDGETVWIWTPIGNKSSRYTGTFDGGEYTVSGLYFNNASTGSVGLFAFVNADGTVKNVGVADSYFCGGSYVGGVVSFNRGNVVNCYNTGVVVGTEYIGGVAGTNSGTVENCCNAGNVIGNYDVSGVAGDNMGTVTGCWNSGSVSGGNVVGGVVSFNYGNVVKCYNSGDVSGDNDVSGVVSGNYDGTVSSCYNSGSVTGTDSVGGVVSKNINGIVTSCYNTGTITGRSYVGGVAGDNGGTVTNCYYLNTCGAAGVGTAKTAAQFQSGEVAWRMNGSTYKGVWKQTIDTDASPNFTGKTVYYGYRNCTYLGYSNDSAVSPISPGDHHYGSNNGFCVYCDTYQPCEGEGTKASPYLITNAGNLYWFAAVVNSGYGDTAQNSAAHAKLTDDIVVNQGTMYESTTGVRVWTPMGYYNDGKDYVDFIGTFDGAGHTISGLYFNDEDTEYVGLFGRLGFADGVTVKNVGVINSYICGNSYVGGVVGISSYGAVVNNCWNTGIVVGNDYIGGVVGGNGQGTLMNCWNSGSVTGKDDCSGGVAGETNTGAVTDCYNTGIVTGSINVGGVVGHDAQALVENCRNIGVVKGNQYVGGVAGGVGVFGGNDESIVRNCYNTGSVTGSKFCVGGVVGNRNKGAVENCYNTAAVTGSHSVGGVVGSSSNGGTTAHCYNTGSVTGTDTSGSVGGVVGNHVGTLTNCWNTGDVNNRGKETGGVVGLNNTGTVTNCYSIGKVDGGTYVGGVVGYNKGSIANCYYDNTAYTGNAYGVYTSVFTNVEGKTTAQFRSGEVACLLQNGQNQQIWGQNIDNGGVNQGHPVFSAAKVYGGYTFCGDAWKIYTNNRNIFAVRPEHDFRNSNGFCRICGGYQVPAGNGTADNPYLITNAGNLYWFAAVVNGGYESAAQNGAAHARLTADILVNEGVMTPSSTDVRVWTPMGYYSSPSDYVYFTGSFDGMGHTVSGLYFNDADTDYVGLFGLVGKNGTVRNVGVVNTYFCGSFDVGSVAGYNQSGGTIENCWSTGGVAGSTNVGGLIGINYGTLTNCYHAGAVNAGGECVGGVVGYNHSAGEVSNCYNIGAVTGGGGFVGGVVGRNHNGAVANCYYLDTACTGGIDGADAVGSAEAKTIALFQSGEVAYLLQGDLTVQVWGQNIDNGETVQTAPVLKGAKVYQTTNCVAAVGYSNAEGIPGAHQWDEGTITTTPNCTQAGVKTFTCQYSAEHMYTEPLDPLGHTEVVDAAVDATCTITGLTEGKHCSVCDEILVAQTTIPELGHQYGEASCDVPATCSECGETTGEALGHADENRDHKCDRSCGKEDMGEHVDENQDHDCDYGCQQSIGTHADSADDADHVCDYGCGEVLEACSDKPEDNDHKCDICGAEDVTGHGYGDWINTDENNHWKACSCGQKSEEGDHVYDNQTDADCNTCGHIRMMEHQHVFAEATFVWGANYDRAAASITCCDAEGGFFSADAAVTAVAEGSKVTFTAEAVLNGTTYTNRRVIEVEKKADGTFTLKLPEKKTDLLVMIAGYEENGRMTGSMMLGGVGVTMEQETVFSMNGDALKVFLLDAKTCAPVMPNLMLQIAE